MEKSKNYSNETQEYITAVTQLIIDTYGRYPKEFAINMRILADNVERYYKCMNDLNTRGTTFKDKQGNIIINPLYKMVKESEQTIFTLSKGFGLNALDKTKIKVIEKNESAEDVLKALMD